MRWVAWRQFRLQALAGFGALAALALVMLLTGLHLRDVYNASGLAACKPNQPCTGAEHFANTYKVLRVLLGDGLIIAPALVGMFWGAPLLARELEGGTFRLAWTQSVTRRRWLAVKVLLVGGASIALCGLYSLMLTWWAQPIDHLELDRFNPGIFDERGIVAIGYGAFAFAVGLLAGALTRRTLLAIAITLLAFIGVRLGLALGVREHLMTPSHRNTALSWGAGLGLCVTPAGVAPCLSTPTIPNAWALSAQIVEGDGRAPSERTLVRFVRSQCPDVAELPGPSGAPAVGEPTAAASPEGPERCAALLAARYHELVSYQPADRYWIFQAIETALYLAISLALIAACFWWIARDAPRREPRALAAGRLRAPLGAAGSSGAA